MSVYVAIEHVSESKRFDCFFIVGSHEFRRFGYRKYNGKAFASRSRACHYGVRATVKPAFDCGGNLLHYRTHKIALHNRSAHDFVESGGYAYAVRLGYAFLSHLFVHGDAFFKESKLLVRKAFDKFANFLYRHFGKFFGKRVSCFSALRSRIENFLSVDYS